MSLSLNLKPLFIFMVFIWLDFFYLETIGSELYHDLMTSIWEKVISILMGNLNSSRSYLLAAVLINLPERNDIGHCTLMFDVLSHTGWILGQTLGINQTVEFNFCCVKCHSHVIWIAWDTNVFYYIFCKKRRPSSHALEKQSKLIARHFGLDQSLPQPNDAKVVHMFVRSHMDMSVVFPRDK